MKRQHPSGRFLRFEGFEFDLKTGELHREGRVVRLPDQPFRILAMLLRRPGRLVSREEIRKELWEEDVHVDFDHSINTAINKIRRALGDSATSPRLIETLPRRGYRFIGEVIAADEFGEQFQGGDSRGQAVPPLPVALRRTPFVSRGGDLRRLLEMLARARKGRGAFALVSGEAGVGKTRLAAEVLLRGGSMGMRPVMSYCAAGLQAPAFGALLELIDQVAVGLPRSSLRRVFGPDAAAAAMLAPKLREVLGEIPDPPEIPPELERRYLFSALEGCLGRLARLRPVVWLVDDAHLADASTLLLLEGLAERIGNRPMLVLATQREPLPEGGLPFGDALPRWISRRLAYRLRLGPLDRTEIAQMLSALGGSKPPQAVVGEFARETQGNPFFLEELYEYLLEKGKLFDQRGRWREGMRVREADVPEGVRLVVGERLRALGRPARKLLRAAAIVGRRFAPELAGRACAMTPEDLSQAVEDAQRRRFIQQAPPGQAGGDYLFNHELTRQSILKGLSRDVRSRTHSRIAAALEALHEDRLDEVATELARHLIQAGPAADRAKLVRYCAKAGEKALEKTAFEEALEYVDNALSHVQAGEAREKARLLHLRGGVMRGLNRWEECLADWSEALTLCKKESNFDRLAAISKEMCVLLAWSGRWRQARQLAENALQAKPDDPDLTGYAALAAAAAGDFDRCEKLLARQKEAEAPRAGRELALGRGLMIEAICLEFQMRVSEALDSALQAADLLRSKSREWELADTLVCAQSCLISRGRLKDSLALSSEIDEPAERLGHQGALSRSRMNQGLIDLMRSGSLDDFQASAEEYLEICREMKFPWTSCAYLHQGRVRFWKGDWEGAAASMRSATELEPEDFSRGEAAGGLFWVKAYRGDGDALDLLERHKHLLPKPGRPNRQGSWSLLLRAAEGLAALGEWSEAGKLYPLVVEALKTGARVLLYEDLLIEKVAAISAAAAGRWDEAIRHFQDALERTSSMPHRIEQAEVTRWYAAMLLARDAAGSRAKALGLADEAIRRYSELGMPRHKRWRLAKGIE